MSPRHRRRPPNRHCFPPRVLDQHPSELFHALMPFPPFLRPLLFIRSMTLKSFTIGSPSLKVLLACSYVLLQLGKPLAAHLRALWQSLRAAYFLFRDWEAVGFPPVNRFNKLVPPFQASFCVELVTPFRWRSPCLILDVYPVGNAVSPLGMDRA